LDKCILQDRKDVCINFPVRGIIIKRHYCNGILFILLKRINNIEDGLMIKNIKVFEDWERQWRTTEGRLPFDRAIRIIDALWQEGIRMGTLPPSNPLEGIETDIKVARILNGCLKGSSEK